MKKILFAGLLAGVLDTIAAIILYAKPVNLHNISTIFRYISRGLFGTASAETGALYPVLGLFLHFFIALTWSVIYFNFITQYFKPGNSWIKILLFACLVWVVMNGFLIPFTGLPSRYDGIGISRSFLVILFCVSLPICLMAEKKSKKSK
jgi:hypothetical protein